MPEQSVKKEVTEALPRQERRKRGRGRGERMPGLAARQKGVGGRDVERGVAEALPRLERRKEEEIQVERGAQIERGEQALA
eukprot:1699966-Rhodomonas_salina.1